MDNDKNGDEIGVTVKDFRLKQEVAAKIFVMAQRFRLKPRQYRPLASMTTSFLRKKISQGLSLAGKENPVTKEQLGEMVKELKQEDEGAPEFEDKVLDKVLWQAIRAAMVVFRKKGLFEAKDLNRIVSTKVVSRGVVTESVSEKPCATKA